MRLHEVIGPHENKEVDLILSGEKPMGIFHDKIPSEFEKHIQDGNLIQDTMRVLNGKVYVIAQPSESWRIQALKNIYENARKNGMSKKYHIQIGKLLGYSEKDIQDFVEKLEEKG